MATVRVWKRVVLGALTIGLSGAGCDVGRAPLDYGRTPDGGGSVVRYDLGARPLPSIPLPNDTATWPDPTSRTGLRVNASLIAPTNLETQARERFSQMEGWGTFAPVTVGFDVDRDADGYAAYAGAALDLDNLRKRHQGDDYEFANDAVYLVNLKTGLPIPLDMGNGNFDYTLKQLDKYWANDPRKSERNLLFETVDETNGGAVTSYAPEHDSDYDGVLDRPNLARENICPGPDPICDAPESGEPYASAECRQRRQLRDRCIADNLLDWYERETDTLVLRPLIPMDEMTRYAVVVTDRTVDGLGNPVRSPFPQVFHAAQRVAATEVEAAIDNPKLANYWGDVAGTGLGRVSFLWSFTTQPTVDDLKRLRDGLYGTGPFARFATSYPPVLELQRAVGLVGGLNEGATDPPNWQTSPLGVDAQCPKKAGNLWIVKFDDLRSTLKNILSQGFGLASGPSLDLLLRRLSAIDHMVIGTYKVPFLLEGGPKSTDPNAAFRLNYRSGEGEETTDTVQVWMMVPKASAKHQQPFNVNLYGHGYTGNFLEQIFYAGNMAEHGLATAGINAMGHGISFSKNEETGAGALLGGACYRPFLDALGLTRARDLDRDGDLDSGGDFWSSYLFHTRDGVRQSVLDHIQLVRIMRAFGGTATMQCRNDGDAESAVRPCDFDGDGTGDVAGDFDGDGVADLGGPDATYGTWGESLGGILSAIHGAIDAYVTSAVPGSGGGGLVDIGVRSFQGGVVEAVLLRLWGPLLVSIPASSRPKCSATSANGDNCTMCAEGEQSVRWVLPNVNGTGEVEVECVDPTAIANSTVLVQNLDTGEVRCTSVDDAQRFRIGLPTSRGDRVLVTFWDGKHQVDDYEHCILKTQDLRHTIDAWGLGRHLTGAQSGDGSATCTGQACTSFEGAFFEAGSPLTSPGEGLGLRRQSPSLRRFIGLAQAALEPGDPVSFSPYYALKSMTDPFGATIAPHAMLTLNTIGDMNVPINSGIAQARAAGAVPFLRPDQAERYPELLDYVTPKALYDALGGRTPNQDLIDRHVVEGITALARHPAGAACATSANAADADATWTSLEGEARACYPSCTGDGDCYSGTRCDEASMRCVPRVLGEQRCEEALWDADDLDEGKHRYFEQRSPVPHRLARLTASAATSSVDAVWAPRLLGVPFGEDANAMQPLPAPAGRITGLLDAYTVPQGEHTFVNGEPCQSFDHGSYLTNLVARFFESDGTDLYYLSHPKTHHCLATETPSCDYAK
ncbi:MAG: hypothetical protein FJ095_05755 [Deltaproteobacteria bacterium]|nr:hypothetical protein [Deltaproteobacteria bacterium]